MSFPVLFISLIILSCNAADDDSSPTSMDTVIDVEERKPASDRQAKITYLNSGSPGHILFMGDSFPSADSRLITIDDDGDGPPMTDSVRLLSAVRMAADPLLEPLLLPPMDVLPEVPDRIGETPLRAQTVIDAEPIVEERIVDVPWVWDDAVCSPLLNQPAPPAGPLTSDQITFSLPLVVRDGKRLKLQTKTGVSSNLHSQAAAATFEKLFWCITALISRVQDSDQRSKLMRKLYEDYLLWMEEDVIPAFNQTDLKRAYKWIKKKDDSQWVVPEKQYYASAKAQFVNTEPPQQTSENENSGDKENWRNTVVLVIFVLIFIVVVLVILYCCLIKRRKLCNLSCFCVCERCRKGKRTKGHEEEHKPLTDYRKLSSRCGRTDGPPKKTYVYRSSSWSSNSSLQPPCQQTQPAVPCSMLGQQPAS